MMCLWRKGWDSNPRRHHCLGGFQDRCLKPLGHPSGFPCCMLEAAALFKKLKKASVAARAGTVDDPAELTSASFVHKSAIFSSASCHSRLTRP